MTSSNFDPQSTPRADRRTPAGPEKEDLAGRRVPRELPPELLIARIERELERLDRRSLASLLRRATAIAVRRSPYFDVLGAFPLPLQGVKAWRRRARTTLRGIEGASAELRAQIEFVAWLVHEPVEAWPSAVELAARARRVEDSEFARVCLGFALLAEGRAEKALDLLVDLARRCQVLRHRWRVLEGIAIAYHALGEDELALRAIEAAAEDARCGVSALVEALQLALRVGDAKRARRAAARLDLLVDPYSPELALALARLRARRVALRPRFAADRGARAFALELSVGRRSAAGRVARSLV